MEPLERAINALAAEADLLEEAARDIRALVAKLNGAPGSTEAAAPKPLARKPAAGVNGKRRRGRPRKTALLPPELPPRPRVHLESLLPVPRAAAEVLREYPAGLSPEELAEEMAARGLCKGVDYNAKSLEAVMRHYGRERGWFGEAPDLPGAWRLLAEVNT